MQSFANLSTALAIAACITQSVNAHGRLLDPPHRGYMFKAGFTKVPADYNDHGLNAGGTSMTSGGQHGICGDPYSAPVPRPHETGGTYGTFPTLGKDAIGKCYAPGSTITVKTQLTANHLGYFRYQLCQLRGKNDAETESCFTTLQTADGSDRVPVPAGKNDYSTQLKLPSGVTCDGDSHCVLRWWYRGGNNSGGDSVPQEEFWNCADVWISNNCGGPAPAPAPAPAPKPTSASPTVKPPAPAPTSGKPKPPAPTSGKPTSKPPAPAPVPTKPTGTCVSVRDSIEKGALDQWCVVNCAAGFCPPDFCKCT